KMGGIGSVMSMMPGMGLGRKGKMPKIDEEQADKSMKRMEAIILSMTQKERTKPDIITPPRKRRIAKGAGVDISEVNKLLKQFEQSRKMMKQMMGGGKRRGGLFSGLPF
ncbi:MAG: signal recognition particle protein, partial [Lachnospiraceae bacterium]|nr:signal recognition particle protein [Lachnospiraceae bacterium]